MDNQQVYIKEILSGFEDIFKNLIELKFFETILFLIIRFKNFNILHQNLMRLLELMTHRFIPDFINEYIFEKLKLDEFLINNIFYFESIKAVKYINLSNLSNFEDNNKIENQKNFLLFFSNKYIFNQRMPAYIPYIIDIFKIFHFCDNNIVKGYIKKSTFK